MVELSFFGPGFGECVAINLGANDWIVVDSCVNPTTGEVAALSYFSQIGVSPVDSVKLVIATHWHDDHVRGLGKLYRECSNATFVCSTALSQKEFNQLVERNKISRTIVKNGLSEFAEVFDELCTRMKGKQPSSIKWAIADTSLWNNVGCPSASLWRCTVHSLSPSHTSFTNSQIDIAKLLVSQDPANNVLLPKDINPNHISVVLHLQIGDYAILLGSDLEETGHPGTGWSVIVDSTTKPESKASIFKIPHHGSVTAHNEDIWNEMLTENPCAVLTPFVNGNVYLPKDTDVARIATYSDNAYSTSDRRIGKTAGRTAAVAKTLREMEAVAVVKSANPPMGQVKVTFNPQVTPLDAKVELLYGAMPLPKLSRVS